MSQTPLEFGADKEDTPEGKIHAIPCHKTLWNLDRVDQKGNPEQKIYAIPCHKTPLAFGVDEEDNPEQKIHAIPCHKTPWNLVLIKKTTQNKKSTPSHVTKPLGMWCW